MRSSRRRVWAAVVAILAIGLVVSGAYILFGRSSTQIGPSLPEGCKKPVGGFLIIASFDGYNGSTQRGVPATPWPVIEVRKGDNVTITICNADTQPHGFQITRYYDPAVVGVVALAPSQVLKISFVASEAGDFRIYCSIPCTVHWAMQSGSLRVS